MNQRTQPVVVLYTSEVMLRSTLTHTLNVVNDLPV